MIRAALLLLLLAGCASRPPPARALAPLPAPQSWAAVLVAGDGSLPVFDNATRRMADLLTAVGTPAADIQRFSAAPDELAKPRVQIATRSRILDALAGLHPAPGQACFVFMTSHGAHGPGLYLAPREEFIAPAALDAALDAGCGSAPTVAIVSACYTGGFAQPPMTRPNRIVLTAAAADRPSFGCGAGQVYTFFDDCLLRMMHALPRDWQEVADNTARCVAVLEKEEHERPSMPQTWIGAEVARLPVPD